MVRRGGLAGMPKVTTQTISGNICQPTGVYRRCGSLISVGTAVLRSEVGCSTWFCDGSVLL